MRKKKSDLTPSVKAYSLVLWAIIALFSSSATYAEDKKLVFKLTQGQGIEVCEVYLQRLNTTEFADFRNKKLLVLNQVTKPPQKDFDDLKPVSLTAEEIQSLYDKITSFTNYQDQYLREKYRKLHKNDAEGKWAIEEMQKLPKRIHDYMNADRQTPFVRYQKKLDMDNDGIATDTVINYNNSLNIVDENLQRVDEAKMMAIFADKELAEWPTITTFPPLAISTNVFSFKGKYYFDGFINLLLRRTGYEFFVDDSVPIKVGVFIHQQQTRKVCEYQLFNNSDEYWAPDFSFRFL